MKKNKYNRGEIEARWKAYWAENEIYKFVYDEGKPMYVVDTPPPYVSADHLHVGHIMSYAQAEFIVRYKRMRGFYVFYPMGWDDNGFPTEKFVEKKYSVDKKSITKSEFVKLCLKETEVGAKNYKKLWTDMGISVDWEKTYSTIDPTATRISQWSLIDLYKKGALYRKEAPIQWCTACQTAVAQADLENEDIDSFMNEIIFKTTSGKELIIATTRPEYLAACVAIYINPNDERAEALTKESAIVPLYDYEIPIMTSEAVDPNLGTGLMMVCTWGDQEDVEKWNTDSLETRDILNKDGTLNEIAKEYEGLTLLEARERILDDLKSNSLLKSQEKLTHPVNTHERCNTPIEFVQTKQWYIKLVDEKETWLDYGNKVNWYPKNRQKDYETWVNSLKWDWCISRQRYYGVPFPIWYCKECDNPIFADEKDLPVDPSEDSPPDKACSGCGGTELVPELDVMDTWATSSCTPFILRELVEDKGIKEKVFPNSLRPNAFEIIRTWDFYSIVKSHYHFGHLPFDNIMISGHGLAEDGRKIAKRLGNYTPSAELIEEYGADAIRFWATGAKLGENHRFTADEVGNGKKTSIKLWNVGNLIKLNQPDKLDIKELSIDSIDLQYEDVWILNELNQTIKKATDAFEKYEYAKSRDYISDFFWNKLADNYLEFVKHRLWNEDGNVKAESNKFLSFVFLNILKLFAPIMPFITEELFHNIFTGELSIHLSSWPEEIGFKTDLDSSDFDNFLKAVEELRKYKTENGISMGKEIEGYALKAELDLDKYGLLLQTVMRIKNITNNN